MLAVSIWYTAPILQAIGCAGAADPVGEPDPDPMGQVTERARVVAMAVTRKSASAKVNVVRWLLSDRLISVASVLTVIVVWYLLVATGQVPALLVPDPLTVCRAFVELLREGYRGVPLYQNIADSFMRVFLGFSLACVTAIPLGLLMAYSARVRALLDLIIEFFRPLPPLAYLTLLLVWFGLGEESKIALLFLVAFPILVISTVAGVRSTKLQKIQAARSLGASPLQVFRYVVLPSALPQIFTAMRLSVGLAYTTVVAAEMMAANTGLGWMVLAASRFLRSDIILVGILLLGILGIALDRVLRTIQSRLVHWEGRE